MNLVILLSSCLDVLRTRVNSTGAAVAVLLKEWVCRIRLLVRPYHAPPY